MKKKAIIKVLKTLARANGCTCDPDVFVTAKCGALLSVGVAHDDWCKHPRTPDGEGEAFDHALRVLSGENN